MNASDIIKAYQHHLAVKGGKARSKALTKKRKREIASMGGKAKAKK